MNRFQTEGLDLNTEQLTNRLATSFQPQQLEDTSEVIDPSMPPSAPATTFGPVRSMVAAVVTAFGSTLVDPNNSQGIDPVLMSLVRQVREDREEELANFFEPVQFNWSKQRYRIRVAAREFSQHTYADYSECD